MLLLGCNLPSLYGAHNILAFLNAAKKRHMAIAACLGQLLSDELAFCSQALLEVCRLQLCIRDLLRNVCVRASSKL